MQLEEPVVVCPRLKLDKRVGQMPGDEFLDANSLCGSDFPVLTAPTE